MTDSSTQSVNTGLKYITNKVYEFLQEKGPLAYGDIKEQLHTKNTETKIRRIYDVLNVLRAVNLVGKRGKQYYIMDAKEDLIKKIEERDKLKRMVEAFEFITSKNKNVPHIDPEDKLYLPFMVITAEADAKVHCDTNEENDYYMFKCDKPLTIYEDLDVLDMLQYAEKRRKAKRMEFLENFMI